MTAKEKPFQTRSEENGLRYFNAVEEAYKAAQQDTSIWKISFSDNNQRIRLVRDADGKFHDIPLGDG